ncbi:hypothetical protein V7S43_018050 [Phytophthora oleae]|uniref:CAP-Gly domain-containing protein n=1 Tax=Phytophthora oleae TaxID=2107226 RepID=A0ABD3ES43_9STRA
MLVSNNDEEPEALAEANRPPDAKTQTAGDVEVKAEWARGNVHGLALSPKSPLAHELSAMLRPQEQTNAASNEDEAAPTYEDDDLPMLESNRTSCATPQEPIMIGSTADEPVDRLSDSVPEGELHVWVYEARQLSAPWPLTDALYDEHKLSVRCTLLGAVQQSPCNISGNKSNPVWRPARDGARDGMGGHFAWALGQPEETAGDAAVVGVEASECKLEIDVVCGARIVASASVALEDLLLSSKARAFEEDASDGSGKVIRLSPHWLPLAGNDAGLLQISLEFVPVPPHLMRKGCDLASIRSSGTETLQENDDDEPAQSNTEFTDHMARQRSARFEPRDLVEACRAVPWLDQRDEVPQQDEEYSKVIVSRSGGVTMYIPTQGESTPPKSKALGSPPLAPKPSTSFGLRPGGEQEQLMDKQLWDLYYFGISDEAPEAGKVRDSERFTHTMSMTSSDFSDLTSRSGGSMYSRHASTCASDVLAYNELIQDMESAIKSMKEETPPSSNQDRSESENQPPMPVKNPAASPPKIHLKLRRLSRPNISKGIDRIQTLWHEAKARASSSSNGSNSPKERRTSDSSPAASPVAFRPQCKTPSPVKGEGIVLFDPQLLPVRLPYQRSSSRDQALEATKAERAAAAGPRRRSLPINTFSLQHRQEMLLQQQRKRSQRQQSEVLFGVQPSLLASVDPPLLSRARSDSLHSLTDVHLPKTGDMHGVEVSTPTNTSSSPAIRGTPNRSTVRRHSGSNVVYINGAPLCVGKLINVGNVAGVVRYIGTTRFATGTWVGIELCEQKGKNSGTVDGEKYFSCPPNHGIFIRASRLDLSVH